MANTPCETKYNRLPDDNFGDGKYVTMDQLEQFRDNQDVHECNIQALWNQTDPEVGNFFKPVLPDEEEPGYGAVLDIGQSRWMFNNDNYADRNELFNNTANIDLVLTTALVNIGTGKLQLHPHYGAKTVGTECLGPWPGHSANAFWNASWDRTKTMVLGPKILADPFGADIPSVARAQTWKSDVSGFITDITFLLHGNVESEDFLYLELRNVNSHGYPGTTVYHRIKFDLKQVKEGMVSIPFPANHRPYAVANSAYAWVLRSPLTSYAHHIGIGGWGSNCKADPYTKGDAFTSMDNCKTWIRHGRNEKVPYKEGAHAPQDFFFVVNVIPDTPVYATTGTAVEQVAYLTPIKSNPVTRITISPSYATPPAGCGVIFEVTSDWINWYPLNAGNAWSKLFSTPYPKKLWLRIRLTNDGVAGHEGNTPTVDSVAIHLDTVPATEAYVRSAFYAPPLGTILGANIWDEFDVDYVEEPNTEVLVDIICGTEQTDVFVCDGTKSTFELSDYPALPLGYVVHSTSPDAGTDVVYSEKSVLKDYQLAQGSKVLNFAGHVPPAGILKVTYHRLWFMGLTSDDFPLKADFMEETFVADGNTSIFPLKTYPVYPARVVTFNGEEQDEDIDFEIDYLKPELDTLTNLDEGTIIVIKYTPDLRDTSMAIAFRMSRTETDKQAYINSCKFQYRV